MENSLLKLAPEQRADIVKDVNKKQEASFSYYEPVRRKWERQYKKYRAMCEEVAKSDHPDLKIALAFGIVEDLTARLIDNVLGKLTILVKPRRPDHSEKADKFGNACRSYYGSSDFRTDYPNSTRERVICGSSWEFDEWLSKFATGSRWQVSETMQKLETALPTLAKVVNFVTNKAVKTYQEVAHEYPVKVGPSTRFPSIFRVHPQPGVKVDRDLGWVIEEVPFVSLEELRSFMYPDPANPKNRLPVYDLSEIDALKEQSPGTVIKPEEPIDTNYRAFEEVYTGVASSADGGLDYGEDGVYLQILRKPREIIVVANGRWLIGHVTDPFQKPGIKCRLRLFTQDPQGLYGIGAIEPIFDILDEVDDVHNMTMADFVRSVNDMLLYDEQAVPYPQDFESRAGGKIRVKSGTVIPNAFLPVPRGPSKAGEMITLESNLKGLAERIISVSDMSPGAMGTKAYHSTYGGLMEISTSLAKRFRLNAVLDQAQTMRHMEILYWFFDQFMFEPLPFTDYSKGEGTSVEYTREDFDTDGLGFCFIASDDPSFGDAAVQRNQNMVLGDFMLRYEQVRRTLSADWDECRPDEQVKTILESFGKTDTSRFIKPANGILKPEEEWAMMLQGLAVDPNPRENLNEHYLRHLWDLRQAERSGQIAPQFLVLVQDHIRKTQMLLSAVIVKPDAFVDDVGREQTLLGMGPGAAAGAASGPQGMIAGPSLGQNAPAPGGVPPSALNKGGMA